MNPTQDRYAALREALRYTAAVLNMHTSISTRRPTPMEYEDALKQCDAALASLEALTKGEAPTVEEIMEVVTAWRNEQKHGWDTKQRADLVARLTAIYRSPVHQQPVDPLPLPPPEAPHR